ncbi:hypothetical protein [uncultured Ramlibacter sp.]|uniref:hypothetical protein n=1 Tax=uncultured Ramlibacter sp. TaxID=260755 RepID=UPI00262AD11B|nr:hypothetical protein [uncultured Ramlibacter sp.]
MSNTTTSIGPGGATGGNETHSSDGCGNKTMGELSSKVPPSRKDLPKAVAGSPGAADKEAAKTRPPKG